MKCDSDVHVRQLLARQHHRLANLRFKAPERAPMQTDGRWPFAFQDGFFCQGLGCLSVWLGMATTRNIERCCWVGEAQAPNTQRLFCRGKPINAWASSPDAGESQSLVGEDIKRDKPLIDPPSAVMSPPDSPPHQLSSNRATGEKDPPQVPDIRPSGP
jgi:hypothetical protein